MTIRKAFALLLCVLMALTALPHAALSEGEPGEEKGGARTHESYFNDESSNTYFSFYDSNTPWVDKTENYYGITTKIIESGNKGAANSRSTITSRPVYMYAGEKIRFNYWYNTQANHDYFKFYANNSVVLERSGHSAYWISYIYTIPSEGLYTFCWEYIKDGSTDDYDDCVRLSSFRYSLHANLYRERAVLAPGCGGISLKEAPGDGIYFFDVSQDTGEHPFYLSATNWHIANSTARVEATAWVPTGATGTHYISFDYKVESEEGCDCFLFKIDGSLIMSGDGEGDYNWKHYRRALAPGYHTFTWEYVKDGDTDVGRDRACIDNIALENFDNAQDRCTNFSRYLHPDNTSELIFNTPEGIECFCGGLLAIQNNNRYVDNSTSFFETDITMRSGEHFSFDYLVSSESYDKFRFYVDGNEAVSAFGWENPQLKTYTFTASSTKTYHFRWEYKKDSSISKGYDTVFILNLKYDGSMNNFTANDIDAIINAANTDEFLHFVGGAGLCGWFLPYYSGSWNAVASINRYYENTASSFGTTCYMNVGDTIGFEYKVDSEDGGDYFTFKAEREYSSNHFEVKDSFSLGGEIPWDYYTFTCTTAGNYRFSWSYEKDNLVNVGDDRAMVDNVSITRMHELDRALNPDGMPQSDWIRFESEGDYVFQPCDFNGRYCAKSGNTGHSASNASVIARVNYTTPDKISFDYYINSEATYDYLVFLANGAEIARFSGQDSTAWHTYTSVAKFSGQVVFEWKYVKDGNLSYGTDTAAIDNVRKGAAGLLGDVDGNGVIDTTDALLALRYALHIIDPDADQRQRADVDGSGGIDTTDALLILRYALHIISSFN